LIDECFEFGRSTSFEAVSEYADVPSVLSDAEDTPDLRAFREREYSGNIPDESPA
jgi:hypothetical protein